MAIPIINRRLSVKEFADYLKAYSFDSIFPQKIVIHHTWRPRAEEWQGKASILGLKRYYDQKGWPAGPHIFIAEDGIWLFSPINQPGIHAASFNLNSIGLEVVGDYDRNLWLGKTKFNALAAIQLLMQRLQLNRSQLHFHREASDVSCPGHAISKEWLFRELDRFQKTYPHLIPPDSLSSAPPSSDPLIPLDAVEAVAFIQKYKLFDIRSPHDIEEAKRFHKFYQLIQSSDDPV